MEGFGDAFKILFAGAVFAICSIAAGAVATLATIWLPIQPWQMLGIMCGAGAIGFWATMRWVN